MENKNRLLLKVQKLNNNRDYNKVIDLLTIETLEEQNNSMLYAEMASAYWNTNNFDNCEKFALKALDLDNKNEIAIYNLGKLSTLLRKFEEAKDYFLKSIDINSKFVPAYVSLGQVFLNLKETKEAEKSFQKAIDLDPKNSRTYSNIGIIFHDLLEFDKAEEYFLKTIKVDSKSAFGFHNLGAHYLGLGEFKKAKKFFSIAIEKNPNEGRSYYSLATAYMSLFQYKEAKEHFINCLNLSQNLNSNLKQSAISKIGEIEKILYNATYKKVNLIVEKIKDLLKYNGEFISHYTGISTVQYLVLVESPLRISEGSFLNDTSEGQELFSYLENLLGENGNKNCNKELFIRRPFIGSFVDENKSNDLTLWRMYGKELLEEAKGCSITLNSKELLSKIKSTMFPDSIQSNYDDIEFFRIAYRNGDKFEYVGATEQQNTELSDQMSSLLEIVREFKQSKEISLKDEKEVLELLNQIAYLFKSVEYKYENEIRLIIKDIFINTIKIDFNNGNFKPSNIPFKVYMELVPIHNLLKKITIGPKVNRAEEWASTFYYHLSSKNLFPEIEISTLPFK